MWCVAIYVRFGVYSSIVASILAPLLYAQESPAIGVFEQVHLLILYLLLCILPLEGDYLSESVSLCKDLTDSEKLQMRK